MTIKTQQAPTVPQLRTGTIACATALCALMTAGMAVAEGAAPTPTHPVRSHHAAAEHLRSLHAKVVAAPSHSHKLQVQSAQSAPEKSKGRGTPAKPATNAKPSTNKTGEKSARDASPKNKTVPQPKSRRRKHKDEDDSAYDPPTMLKARAGRHGHGPVLMRVHGRWMARQPIADNSHLVMIGPAPLRGSHDILVHQNLMADDEGLERIQDEDDLDRLRTSHDLIDFDESRSLRINPELPWNRRCARLWTVKFAQDLSTAFYEKFGQPLQVNSAARSVEYQLRLARTNGNAAGIEGEAASPHLTGQAIDIGKRGMNRAQLAWMRARLLPLIETGEIDVEEEFRQACFHISVYRSYLPVTRALPKHELAQLGTQTGNQAGTKAPIVRVPPIAPARDSDPQP